MSKMIQPPIKGFSEGFNVEESSRQHTGDINNMRPVSTLSGKIILCQRPGQDKKFAAQLASVAGPVVVQGSVAIVS